MPDNNRSKGLATSTAAALLLIAAGCDEGPAGVEPGRAGLDPPQSVSVLLESNHSSETGSSESEEREEYSGCLNEAPHLEIPEIAVREPPVRDFHAREPEELPERFDGFRGEREPTVARFAVSAEVLQLQEEYLARSADLTQEEAAELKAVMFGE